MIKLFVEAPFVHFRKSYSRSVAETYTVAPPSTVRGFLLSLVGELNRNAYPDANLKIGTNCDRIPCEVLRTEHRVKVKDILKGCNRTPKRQFILTDYQMWVQLSHPELEARIVQAIERPETIERFGTLSLGESSNLVSEVEIIDGFPPDLLWLTPDPFAIESYPVTTDFNGTAGTVFERLSLQPDSVDT